MARATSPIRADRRARTRGRLPLVLAAVLAVGFSVLVAVSVTTADRSAFDDALPNPMGGAARTAPGEATGELELAGLRIGGAEVAMGEIGLGVTYVPEWEVANPTDREVVFTAGQPQVLEGCCPGPIYVDGELTHAGQGFAVPPGGAVVLQFPLQMHRGMDGPHHLSVPLLAEGQEAAVHVTGNFTPRASAS